MQFIFLHEIRADPGYKQKNHGTRVLHMFIYFRDQNITENFGNYSDTVLNESWA